MIKRDAGYKSSLFEAALQGSSVFASLCVDRIWLLAHYFLRKKEKKGEKNRIPAKQ